MKKATEIAIGSKVITPVTDGDGQLEHVTGILISINSRFAKVDLGDRVVNVGKSKIELVEAPKSSRKLLVMVTVCPHCGVSPLIKATITGDDWFCNACDGPVDFEDDEHSRIGGDYEYTKVKAASGRQSVDAGDDVALILRGQTLEEVYRIVANKLEQTQKSLRAKYQHLNPGHQRMCLGNLLRGWFKRNK